MPRCSLISQTKGPGLVVESASQKLMATSSTHAENRSLFELSTVLVFLKHLFDENGRPIKLPMDVLHNYETMLSRLMNGHYKRTSM